MGNLVIFVVGLLNNWLVKVAETFTDILNYYVLQTTANKFAVHVKVYVVKKYLKSLKNFCSCVTRHLRGTYMCLNKVCTPAIGYSALRFGPFELLELTDLKQFKTHLWIDSFTKARVPISLTPPSLDLPV